MAVFLDMALKGCVLLAWGFLIWGMIKELKARRPEHARDRNLQVGTFWVFFFGSILWLIIGTANAFFGEPFLLEGFLTILLGHRAYALNKTIRTL